MTVVTIYMGRHTARRKQQTYSANGKGAVEESTRHALSLDVRWPICGTAAKQLRDLCLLNRP